MSNQREKNTRTLSSIERSLIIPQNHNNKRKRDVSPTPDDGTLIQQDKRKRIIEPYPSKEELVANVLAFVEKHGAIRQGTPRWYDLMGTTIGGSEMSVLFGMNKYMKRNELLEKKRNPSNSFNQPVACLWGKLFEKVIRTFAEVEFRTQIYGHDICINDGRLRYSPDGIGVVLRRKNSHIFDIVLFEFKCPYIRIPNGIVPKQYEPQLWSGLAALEEIRPAYAMYIDAVFRKCSQDQLNATPDYDRQYHSKGCPLYGKPVAYGVMNVYSKGDDTGEKLVDYGAADGIVFNKMLEGVDNGVLFTSLVYLKYTNDRADILGPQGRIDGMYYSGIIPFKIMRVIGKKVKSPFPNFGERIAAEVDKFFEDVNKA